MKRDVSCPLGVCYFPGILSVGIELGNMIMNSVIAKKCRLLDFVVLLLFPSKENAAVVKANTPLPLPFLLLILA